jgi:hypothetical protein
MKKILYSLTILLGLSLIGCSEADNLAGNGDTSPTVVIYSYDAPADKDKDATANLRFVPNMVCEKFYVLVEKKTERDIFVNNYGHPAYAQKVVTNGVQYPAQTSDIIFENLAGEYSITAVGVNKNGEIGKAFDITFIGIEWIAAGTADINSDWAGDIATVPVERRVGTNIYRLVSPYWYLEPAYCPNEGYHVMFEVDANYDAVYLYPSNIGEEASNGSWFLVCSGYENDYGCSFTNTGNVYIIDGIWGRGPDSSHLTLVYYAYEIFEWHR